MKKPSVLFVVILIVSASFFFITGCYKATETANGIAVVNTFTGDVFFPETKEFVEYPEKEDRRNEYNYYSGYYYRFENESTTPSGFRITSNARIEYDTVFYRVEIEPTDAHINDIIAERAADDSGSTQFMVVKEELVDSLRNSRFDSVTISLKDSDRYELASKQCYLSEATGILEDGIVTSVELSGTFEIKPRYADDVRYISASFTF